MRIKTALIVAIAFSLMGCRRNPIERLSDPNPGGAVPQSSGVFDIYDDELKTGGGLALIPGGQNQSISLTDTSAPHNGSHFDLLYGWNGGDVLNNDGVFRHTFAGFTFPQTSTIEASPGAPGRDLSAAGYTKLHFFIRGTLTTGNRLRIEGPGDGTNTPVRMELAAAELSPNNWQEIILPVPAADFSNIRSFLTISIQFDQPPRTDAPGNGGIVYLDDITYEK